MAEPLKDVFNKDLLIPVAKSIVEVYDSFDSRAFLNKVFDENWEHKTLKMRINYITKCLHEFLPNSYLKSLEILKEVSSSYSDYLLYSFFPNYVQIYGMEHFEHSISALEHFTKLSTSEFAIRSFIVQFPEKTIKQMHIWAESDNEHVRRLASEGCRPRLPWAGKLQQFIEDPKPIIKILEKLKNDESEYVRRSVANNLNDISKDNPESAITIFKKWYGKSDKTNKIVKHASRTLLKKGEPELLKLFKLNTPDSIKVSKLSVSLLEGKYKYLEVGFELKNQNKKELGNIRVECIFNVPNKINKYSRKVYLLKQGIYNDHTLLVSKKCLYKTLFAESPREDGSFFVQIVVNGKILKKMNLSLDS